MSRSLPFLENQFLTIRNNGSQKIMRYRSKKSQRDGLLHSILSILFPFIDFFIFPFNYHELHVPIFLLPIIVFYISADLKVSYIMWTIFLVELPVSFLFSIFLLFLCVILSQLVFLLIWTFMLVAFSISYWGHKLSNSYCCMRIIY